MGGVQRVGAYAAWTAFLATVAYGVVQLLQVAGLLGFPADEILIYSTSLLIAVPFLIAMLALHYSVEPGKRFWSHGALIFSTIYVVYVVLNYVTQLATVIPAKLGGTLDAVAVLDQTPHSLCWNLDALGYIFLGLATGWAAPVFSTAGRGRWAKRFFLANAAMTPVISVVYFYPVFSTGLLLLGLPWLVTAPGSMLQLALHFRTMPIESDSYLPHPSAAR